MTDQTAPDTTNHDRRLAHSWAETVKTNPDNWGRRQLAAARVILDDLPDPPPPTLADMLPKERRECKWMQADVDGWDERAVIAGPAVKDGFWRVLNVVGDVRCLSMSNITPRPDLPRLAWPGTEKPAPALPEGWRLADHKENGRAIVDRWNLPLHRTEAGYPNCSTCDGGGCPDCTDPA